MSPWQTLLKGHIKEWMTHRKLETEIKGYEERTNLNRWAWYLSIDGNNTTLNSIRSDAMVAVTVLRCKRTVEARFAHRVIILDVKMINASLGRSVIAFTLAFMNSLLITNIFKRTIWKMKREWTSNNGVSTLMKRRRKTHKIESIQRNEIQINSTHHSASWGR